MLFGRQVTREGGKKKKKEMGKTPDSTLFQFPPPKKSCLWPLCEQGGGGGGETNNGKKKTVKFTMTPFYSRYSESFIFWNTCTCVKARTHAHMHVHTHTRTHAVTVLPIAAQVFVQHWSSFRAKEAYEFSTGNLNQKEM